jgi:hypothetical protein
MLTAASGGFHVQRMRAKRKWVGDAREIGATGENAAAPTPKKDGAPVPGSPGLQAISFNTSCEIEIADNDYASAGPTRLWYYPGNQNLAESGRGAGFGPPDSWLMSAQRATGG